MKHILFLCPHSVAKSVIASSYAQRFAQAANLKLSVAYGGTEPDEFIPQKVIDLLASDGFDVSHWQPHLVTNQNLEQADYVVSLGCDLQELGVNENKSEFWDVPAPSEDLIACRDAVRDRVQKIVSEWCGSKPTAA